MTRFWLLVALLVVGILLLRRSFGAGRRAPPRREERLERSATRTCAECGTRYDPQLTAGTCPRCGK